MSGGVNPNAWNNWYHVIGSTHGTWLQGDPRGFRTFQHRQHVDGDYRHPPPAGVYAPIFVRCKARLKHPPVELTTAQRDLLCRALAERLRDNGTELVALAVAMNHSHLLARFPALPSERRAKWAEALLNDGRDPAPRHWLAMARKHGSYELRRAGLKPDGPVWADRPKCDPIRDRMHQVNVARYIRDHTRIGAAVWYLGQFHPARDAPDR